MVFPVFRNFLISIPIAGQGIAVNMTKYVSNDTPTWVDANSNGEAVSILVAGTAYWKIVLENEGTELIDESEYIDQIDDSTNLDLRISCPAAFFSPLASGNSVECP